MYLKEGVEIAPEDIQIGDVIDKPSEIHIEYFNSQGWMQKIIQITVRNFRNGKPSGTCQDRWESTEACKMPPPKYRIGCKVESKKTSLRIPFSNAEIIRIRYLDNEVWYFLNRNGHWQSVTDIEIDDELTAQKVKKRLEEEV
jgi:hypothetical protein